MQLIFFLYANTMVKKKIAIRAHPRVSCLPSNGQFVGRLCNGVDGACDISRRRRQEKTHAAHTTRYEYVLIYFDDDTYSTASYQKPTTRSSPRDRNPAVSLARSLLARTTQSKADLLLNKIWMLNIRTRTQKTSPRTHPSTQNLRRQLHVR